MLKGTAVKDNLKKWGVDLDALVAAVNAPEEKDFSFEVKPEVVKANFPTYSFLDEAELNGLKGRTKDEVLKQAEEIGIKAIKEKAGVTFDGKDPGKFLEALTAHLKIPVDDKLKEKDKDILTLQETLKQEKEARSAFESRIKDRDELDNFSKLLPVNKTKVLRDAEIRSRYKEDGYTLGEYDDNGAKKPALFKNGEVVKDKELKLVDPKAHVSEWMKSQNLLEAEQQQAANTRRTFDTNTNSNNTQSKFNHDAAYETAMNAGGGKWNEKAQATYTEMLVAAGK